MPTLCVFLVDGAAFECFRHDTRIRHFKLRTFGVDDIQILAQMMLQHIPKETISFKSTHKGIPVIHIILQTQQVNYDVQIELGDLQKDETINAAMARSLLLTDFNVYALYIDLTRSWERQTLFVGGNIELVNHEIAPMFQDDHLFIKNPRLYTRAINALLRYDLPFNEYLRKLIHNHKSTIATLSSFLNTSERFVQLHAQEISNAFVEILGYCDIKNVITTYNSFGYFQAMTTLASDHIDRTLASIPALYSKNNEQGNIFLSRKKWATIIASFYAHYVANHYYSLCMNLNNSYAQHRYCMSEEEFSEFYTTSLSKALKTALENCPLNVFISCIESTYQIYFTFIKNKYLVVNNPEEKQENPESENDALLNETELRDRPFKEMVGVIDHYQKKLFDDYMEHIKHLENQKRQAYPAHLVHSMHPMQYPSQMPMKHMNIPMRAMHQPPFLPQIYFSNQNPALFFTQPQHIPPQPNSNPVYSDPNPFLPTFNPGSTNG